MPSKSPAQHRLMEAVAHSKQVAEHLGIPQDVALEFVNADKRQHERKESPAKERMENHKR